MLTQVTHQLFEHLDAIFLTHLHLRINLSSLASGVLKYLQSSCKLQLVDFLLHVQKKFVCKLGPQDYVVCQKYHIPRLLQLFYFHFC